MKKIILLFTIFCSFSLIGSAQTSTEQSLNTLLVKKREFNKNAKKGFCIQLYNGNEKSAIARMERFTELFPEIIIKRIYKVPEWKVQTNSYKTKLEADKILNLIKDDYPGARVL